MSFGRGVPINLALAQSWFERAAATGHLDAETTLGLLLFQNGDQAHGLKWLKQAAEQGEPRAQLVYGTALYNGDGVTQDKMLGYAYVSRAADQGLAPARDTLAQLDQLMTVADRRKAMTMVSQQAKTGSRPATTSSRPARSVRSADAQPPPPKAAPKPVVHRSALPPAIAAPSKR